MPDCDEFHRAAGPCRTAADSVVRSLQLGTDCGRELCQAINALVRASRGSELLGPFLSQLEGNASGQITFLPPELDVGSVEFLLQERDECPSGIDVVLLRTAKRLGPEVSSDALVRAFVRDLLRAFVLEAQRGGVLEQLGAERYFAARSRIDDALSPTIAKIAEKFVARPGRKSLGTLPASKPEFELTTNLLGGKHD